MPLIPYRTDAPVYHFPLVTIGLIVTNIAVHCWTQVDWSIDRDPFVLTLGNGLHPVQWLTHMFLHGDAAHLLGNMIFLWCFGLTVEGKVGWWKFLTIYLVIGIAVGCTIQVYPNS